MLRKKLNTHANAKIINSNLLKKIIANQDSIIPQKHTPAAKPKKYKLKTSSK